MRDRQQQWQGWLQWQSWLKGMMLAGCALVASPLAAAGTASEKQSADMFRFGPGPYLVLDTWLVQDQANLKRTIHQPEKRAEPVVTAKEDGNFQPYISVVREPDSGRFRMWYNTPETASQSHLSHITSADGIHWDRPHRQLVDPAFIQFGASVIDQGPAFANASQRYKFAFWAKDENGVGGLKIATSPNGLDWHMLRPGIVLAHNHDITAIQWDPIRQQYLAFISCKKTGPTWIQARRIPHQSVSKDLIHWEKPWMIVQPEMGEEGETQFYCVNGLLVRGHLLVALVKVLRDDLNAEPNTTAADMGDHGRKAAGIGYTVLAWSRDGRTWQRDIEPFLDRNQEPGTWDRAHVWADRQVTVGDEVFIYYGGYARGHKVERFGERQVGLARMRRDRYVSLDADGGEGRFRTVAAPLTSPALTINANLRGPLRVRVLDDDADPCPGFDFDDCQPIQGDSLRHPVEWKQPLKKLHGREVQFEFAWTDGQVFSFDLQ